MSESRAVEISAVSAGEFSRHSAAFRDLVARAAQPNVFMEPSWLNAAEATDRSLTIHVLLASKIIKAERRLVGVWAFALRKGLRRLAAPAHPLGALGAPAGRSHDQPAAL